MSVKLFISCRRRINDGPQSQKYMMHKNILKDIFYSFTELEIKYDYLERVLSSIALILIDWFGWKQCWIFIFNPSVKHIVLKVRGEDFLPGWGTSERNLSSWSPWTPEGCSRIAPGGRPAWFPPRSQTSDDGGLGSNDPHEVCTHREIRVEGRRCETWTFFTHLKCFYSCAENAEHMLWATILPMLAIWWIASYRIIVHYLIKHIYNIFLWYYKANGKCTVNYENHYHWCEKSIWIWDDQSYWLLQINQSSIQLFDNYVLTFTSTTNNWWNSTQIFLNSQVTLRSLHVGSAATAAVPLSTRLTRRASNVTLTT